MSDVVRTSIREHLDAAPDEVDAVDDVTVADQTRRRPPSPSTRTDRRFERSKICSPGVHVAGVRDDRKRRGHHGRGCRVLPDRLLSPHRYRRRSFSRRALAVTLSRPRAAGTAAEIWPGPHRERARMMKTGRGCRFFRRSTTFATPRRLMTDFGTSRSSGQRKQIRTAGTISVQHLPGSSRHGCASSCVLEDAADAGNGSDECRRSLVEANTASRRKNNPTAHTRISADCCVTMLTRVFHSVRSYACGIPP